MAQREHMHVVDASGTRDERTPEGDEPARSSPAVESALGAAWDEARRCHPGGALTRDAFQTEVVARVRARLGATRDPPGDEALHAALARVVPGDVYFVIDACRARDEAARAALAERLATWIDQRFADGALADLARHVLSELIVDLAEREHRSPLDSYCGSATLELWFTALVYNRRRFGDPDRKRRHIQLGQGDDDSARIGELADPSARDPSEAAGMGEITELVTSATRTVTPDPRETEILCKSFRRGLTQGEIARHLGIDTSSVSRSLSALKRRYLNALRRSLPSERYEDFWSSRQQRDGLFHRACRAAFGQYLDALCGLELS